MDLIKIYIRRADVVLTKEECGKHESGKHVQQKVTEEI